MPAIVAQSLRDQGFVRSVGPHAADTVRRRLASWSTLTKWRGLSGAFASPALKSAIRLAVRATPRPRRRKSAKAVTGDVLAKMLATCGDGSLRDVRDRAILMVAFASGGRRRSEIAGLRVDQISVEPPIEIDNGNILPSRAIHLGRTKTSGADHDEVVYLTGRLLRRLMPGSRRRNFWRECVSEDRSLGECLGAGDGGECGQCDRQAACRNGRSRSGGVFGARAAVGISHRGGQSWYPAARGNGTVAASIGATGVRVL